MASPFDELPDELLIEVLSWLPKTDLKPARLSCRRLRNAGDNWLFRRLYFAPREKTMDAFQYIAANPAFNRHITDVIYDGRLFQPHFLEPEMYFRAYKWHVQAQGRERERAILADCERAEKEIRRDLKDIRSTGSKPSERERAALKALRERTYRGRVLKSMKQYVMFCIKQETIFDTGRDKEVLCASLKQMPNVYRLSIIDQFAKVNQELGVEHRWYEKESTESFGCSLAPMRWPARYQKGFRDASDEHIRPSNRPWDCRGIVSILKAAATHSKKIDKLELGLGSSNAPLGILQMLSSDLTPIQNIARGLICLKLNMSPAWTSADIDHFATPEEVSCLKTLLQETKGLFSLHADVALTCRQWDNVFSGLYLPHLVMLHLGRLAYLRPNDLIGLLERHKRTLRELSISEADLRAEPGTWQEVAQRLGQSLNLRYIGLGRVAEIDEIGRFEYSCDGFFKLATLFIPSYSPQSHYLVEGLDAVEVMQREFEPDPWYLALEARAKRMA